MCSARVVRLCRSATVVSALCVFDTSLRGVLEAVSLRSNDVSITVWSVEHDCSESRQTECSECMFSV